MPGGSCNRAESQAPGCRAAIFGAYVEGFSRTSIGGNPIDPLSLSTVDLAFDPAMSVCCEPVVEWLSFRYVCASERLRLHSNTTKVLFLAVFDSHLIAARMSRWITRVFGRCQTICPEAEPTVLDILVSVEVEYPRQSLQD